MYPRLKNCRFKVGSGARREKRNFQNSQDSRRIIFHLCISFLWASNKLQLVIKSLGSQRRCPSFSFSTMFSVIFSFPASLLLSGRRSLRSETAVSVTWERNIRKASAVRSAGVSLCLSGNLIEESWKDLSASLGKEGQRSSCLPLTIWRNSNLTFSFFSFFCLCSFGSIYWVKAKLPGDTAWEWGGVSEAASMPGINESWFEMSERIIVMSC